MSQDFIWHFGPREMDQGQPMSLRDMNSHLWVGDWAEETDKMLMLGRKMVSSKRKDPQDGHTRCGSLMILVQNGIQE